MASFNAVTSLVHHQQVPIPPLAFTSISATMSKKWKLWNRLLHQSVILEITQGTHYKFWVDLDHQHQLELTLTISSGQLELGSINLPACSSRFELMRKSQVHHCTCQESIPLQKILHFLCSWNWWMLHSSSEQCHPVEDSSRHIKGRHWNRRHRCS